MLSAIQEIVINLIGSEELAIYEMDDDGTALRLVGSFGIDPVAYATVPIGSGIIGKTAISGDIYLPGKGMDLARTPRESNLTVCVPLKLDEPGLRLPRDLPSPAAEERPRGDRLRAVQPPRRARRDRAVPVEAAWGEDGGADVGGPHPRPLSRERERGRG